MKKRISWKIKTIFNEITAFARTYPNFLIIGSSYCGKTLLYNYLTQHPQVCSNLREETGYFISNSHKSHYWYRSNFPSVFYTGALTIKNKHEPLIGETVNLAGTFVPERVVKVLGSPKIIAILRNPVDRAYARYLAMVREGFEKLPFEEALENETRTIVENEEKLLKDGIWPPLDSTLPLYRLSGIYIDYILRWNKFLPMKEMLVLSSEELFQNPLETTNKALEFLNLTSLKKIHDVSINYEEKSPSMNNATKGKLQEYYKPHNLRLFNFIDKEFDWG